MSKLTTFSPKNLSELLTQVQDLQKKAGHPLWFRGAGLQSHKLIPSLYRHPQIDTLPDIPALERQLIMRFRQRSLPYHSRDLGDDWDALFFMQHYGVPTRLLDWTENPFTALHFALMTAPVEVDAAGVRNYPSAACLWVLDPNAWNAAALSDISYQGGPLTLGDEGLKGYPPGTALNTYPVAMFGAHNSARIVAQQGVFTIFGKDRTAMETLVRKGTFPPETLSMISIPASRIKSMRESLLNQGITESTIFPDLDGLARETKRYFGFEA